MHVTPSLSWYFKDCTGCGLVEGREALEKCKSLESAVTYLLMRHDACCRRKEDGQLWTDQDYIDYANAHPSNRVDFSE